jgi:hypothetical protein
MAKATEEEVRKFYNPEDIQTQIREYIRAKNAINMMESRTKELRDAIFAYIDEQGEEDGNGSISVPLDTSIDGVVRLEKQRRVSRKINESAAEAIIEAKNLGEAVYETKRVINEEALMAAYFNGEISEDELDSMFPVEVSWALRTPKK